MPTANSAPQAAAAQRRPCVHPVLLKALCHPVILKALCTAPATKSALQVHQALRLPRILPSRLTKRCACHELCTTGSRSPAVTARPPGPPEGSAYCAYHEICTPRPPSAAPTTKSTLQVHQALRLPRNLHDRQPRPGGDHASTQYSSRLCVLRLSRNLHCRFTKRCAYHEICTPGSQSAAPATKSAQQAAAAQRLRLRRNLCTYQEICTAGSQSAVPATKSARQAAAAQHRPGVHRVLLKAL